MNKRISFREKYTNILCLIFLFCIGCNDSHKRVVIKSPEKIVIKEYYPNGGIKSEQEVLKYSDDSMIADGYYKEYFENGKLYIQGFFKKNIQHGLIESYYENGAIFRKYTKEDGWRRGFAYEYYNNGKLKWIEYYRNDSQKSFEAKFDSFGRLDTLKGALFGAGPTTINNKTFDTVNMIYHGIVKLNGLKTILRIRVTDKDNHIIAGTSVTNFVEMVNDRACRYAHVFSKPGTYVYENSLSLVDSLTGKIIKNDSFKDSIIVK